MKLFITWFVGALAIGVTAYLLPGVSVDGVWTALVLAVVLGAINAFVKPVLFWLTLPLSVLTLGIFSFILNAILILGAAAVVPGFVVASFWWALGFSLVLALVQAVFERFAK